MTHHQNHRGFSILEVMVAIGLVAIILYVSLPWTEPTLRAVQKQSTQRSLGSYAKYWEAWYAYSAYSIALRTDQGSLSRSAIVMNVSTQRSELTSASVRPQRTVAEVDALSIDGWRRNVQVVLGPQLSKVWRDGITILYRDIHVISPGVDGVISSSYNSSTSLFTRGGDDLVVTISGFDIAARRVGESLARLEEVGKSFQAYFRQRMLADSVRDPLRNYFMYCPSAPDNCDPSSVGAWQQESALFSTGPSDVGRRYDLIGIPLETIASYDTDYIEVGTGFGSPMTLGRTAPLPPPFTVVVLIPAPASMACGGTTNTNRVCREVLAPV